ncbi:hypothetical protein EVAR_62360_1 [Eumeta japonica]|uniref:Uncharacterized protein n=1 Tax=Eumeta variegata TaxID=151549 RepID=A0A4C2A141_EUMVA|nr:hypothetical protein EVAR_62360_1 [Eumeta japonica]
MPVLKYQHTNKFLTEKNVELMSDPAYNSDLALCIEFTTGARGVGVHLTLAVLYFQLRSVAAAMGACEHEPEFERMQAWASTKHLGHLLEYLWVSATA